eukprot:715519-Amorphochlora_amoeboformis.AAC.2
MADQLPPKDKADLSTKVKGILKKAPAGPMRKDFKWDEKNLDRNEHGPSHEAFLTMQTNPLDHTYLGRQRCTRNICQLSASEEEESEGKEAETNIGPLLEHEPEQGITQLDDESTHPHHRLPTSSESNLNFKNARKRHYSMG